MSEAWNIRFGTAGTSDSFAAQGYKSSLDVPEYTAKMGLNAFEYQCGQGVRLGLDKAARMAALAAQRDILFSVHAPYYISMSSLEEDKRLNSIQYLLQSAAVCRALGGRRMIFHSGSCGKQSREAALEKELDMTGYTANDRRVFGFVSERLLDAWLITNNISFEELDIVYMEHQNWLHKGTAFLKLKFFPKKDD